MSEVQVHKIQTDGERVLALAREADLIYEEIGLRAFLRFESRGGLHGYDREDWLEAERSLVFAPPAELLESDDGFTIRIAVPGFDASQIHVNVLPSTVIVDGDSATTNQANGTVLLSESNDRKLLRRVDLPAEVRTYTATAALQDGVLDINVRKAAVENEPVRQTVAATA